VIAKLNKDQTHYIIKGKQYPRLSEVMKVIPNFGLEKWKERVGYEEAERIAKETNEYGTKVHLITMYNDLDKQKKVYDMVKSEPFLLPPLLAWINYYEKYIKKWIAIERLVWSDELMVAGTIDRVDEFFGEKALSIHDIKTGSLYNEIGIRLAGYKIIWNEREKRKVERYSAVQLPRENPGEIRVKEYTNPKYEEKFREACETYHLMYG